MAAANPQWTSRFAFLMAAIGSAVGLGNLWRFPFFTGQNGGAAFVFVYLICVAFVAYPVLMGEFAVGRHMGLSAVGSTRQTAVDAGKSARWSVVGWVGVLAAFTALSTYSVVAGQVIAYSLMSFLGEFSAQAAADTAPTASLYAGSTHALIWHTLFMGVTVLIVAAGLKGGIERVVTVLMPIFFLMLFALCAYALTTGAAGQALSYLFAPDFSALTPVAVLAALGQAFFSVGVGAAIMITYGSFLPKEENIGSSAAVIAGSDTMVAIVAGLMIFPIIFANGLDPAAGDSLIFDAMPAIFSGMPAGAFVGGLFFFLAFIAAVTSSISLLLAVSAVGIEQFGLSRAKSAMLSGGLVWVVGAAAVTVSGLRDWVNFVGGSIILPVGGLLLAIFVGWVVPRKIMRDELHNASDRFYATWRFMCRYLAPVAVGLILILGIDAKFELGISAMLTAE